MRFSPVVLGLAVALALVALSPVEAHAHLGLNSPTSRYGPDVLKTGPCGTAGGVRTDRVTYYEPGETIEVRWDEYVDHPGHYRIAFDDDGDDDFVDPATMMEFYSNDTVLLDEITDKDGGQGDYVATVTLPDVICDNCTLQVIQVMYDKPPYTRGTTSTISVRIWRCARARRRPTLTPAPTLTLALTLALDAARPVALWAGSS
jgi:hypothetical protein